MKDKNLLSYIFGLITGVILLPVIDELLNVLYGVGKRNTEIFFYFLSSGCFFFIQFL